MINVFIDENVGVSAFIEFLDIKASKYYWNTGILAATPNLLTDSKGKPYLMKGNATISILEKISLEPKSYKLGEAQENHSMKMNGLLIKC